MATRSLNSDVVWSSEVPVEDLSDCSKSENCVLVLLSVELFDELSELR